MLLFLNIDCVLTPPSDAIGPDYDSATGVRRLEALLGTWPQLRAVITSDRRYRMTLQHFRSFFSMPLRHRLIATTPLYGLRHGEPKRRREEEIADWLQRTGLTDDGEWLALDDSRADYARHARRLVACDTLTREAVVELHEQLMRWAFEHQTVVRLPEGGRRPDALSRRPETQPMRLQ